MTRWDTKVSLSITRINQEYPTIELQKEALENYILFLAKQLDYKEKRFKNLNNSTIKIIK